MTFTGRHEYPYTLFCGYSAVHFGAEKSATALELICRCHSEVRVHAADDLSSWLVNGVKPLRAAPVSS